MAPKPLVYSQSDGHEMQAAISSIIFNLVPASIVSELSCNPSPRLSCILAPGKNLYIILEFEINQIRQFYGDDLSKISILEVCVGVCVCVCVSEPAAGPSPKCGFLKMISS